MCLFSSQEKPEEAVLGTTEVAEANSGSSPQIWSETQILYSFLALLTLSPSTKVCPSLALLQEMSGRGSPSATQEIMAALPSTAVTFFSCVMWGWTGGHGGGWGWGGGETRDQ